MITVSVNLREESPKSQGTLQGVIDQSKVPIRIHAMSGSKVWATAAQRKKNFLFHNITVIEFTAFQCSIDQGRGTLGLIGRRQLCKN